ncbi:MAG: hypothetical protein RR720_17105 [Comamonas sp.]|uniref:hypothetical protein n=1 Tax=Comamonas sp. TaxID=34028 RepID=UPI002FC58275
MAPQHLVGRGMAEDFGATFVAANDFLSMHESNAYAGACQKGVLLAHDALNCVDWDGIGGRHVERSSEWGGPGAANAGAPLGNGCY